MKTLSLAQAFANTIPDGVEPYPWQRKLKEGDRCLFVIHPEGRPTFLYLIIKPAPANTPQGYYYGECYSDLAKNPETPGQAIVHPTNLVLPLSEAQFEAARATGFKAAHSSAAYVMNYVGAVGDA